MFISKNQKFKKNYAHELTDQHCTDLVSRVRNLADSVNESLNLRRDLFLQIEPFSREFDEYYKSNDPADRKDVLGYSMTQILSNVSSKKMKKYRASLLAWFSYYHETEFLKFCELRGMEFEPYTGDPDLNTCSEAAKEMFHKASVYRRRRLSSETVESGNSIPAATRSLEVAEADNEKNRKLFPFFATIFCLALVGIGASGWYFQSRFFNYFPNVKEVVAVPIETLAKTEVLETTEVWNNIPKELWINGSVTSFRKYAKKSDKDALLKAAQDGNAQAQGLAAVGHHLGILSQYDHGLEIREFGKEACANKIGVACLLVADHYTTGRGNIVKKNQKVAMQYYKLGCEHNFSEACDRVAYRTMIGTQDIEKISLGISLMKKSCGNGRADSCSGLAFLYLRDDVRIPADVSAARKYYQKACDLGEQESCNKGALTNQFLLETGVGHLRPSENELRNINAKYNSNNAFYTYGNTIPPQIDYYTAKPSGFIQAYANSSNYFEEYGLRITVQKINNSQNNIQFTCNDMDRSEVVYLGDFLRLRNSKGEYVLVNVRYFTHHSSGEVSINFAVFRI